MSHLQPSEPSPKAQKDRIQGDFPSLLDGRSHSFPTIAMSFPNAEFEEGHSLRSPFDPLDEQEELG